MKMNTLKKLPIEEIIERFSLSAGLPLQTSKDNSDDKRNSTLPVGLGQQSVPSCFGSSSDQILQGHPIMGGVVNETTLNTQAPEFMVMISAIANSTPIVHGLYDIQSPLGAIHPISLNVLTVANSGERKTTVDKSFSKSTRLLEKVINNFIREYNENVDAELESWEVENKVLKSDYKAARKKGVWVKEKNALYEHSKLKPERLKYVSLTHDDFTDASLLRDLNDIIPVAAISSTEAAKILDGAGINLTPVLNKLWDGAGIHVSRISRESFWLENVRLSTSLMLQPELMRKILRKREDELRGSGYLARTIVCCPESKIGSRPVAVTKPYTEKCDLFHRRLAELCVELLWALVKPDFKRKLLKLDQAAEQEWLRFANDIESKQQPGGYYHAATDHASKLAENVLRVAGVLHAVEFGDGEISICTLQAAINICLQSSSDFMRCFVPPPQNVQFGQKLQRYIYDNFGVSLVGKTASQMYFDERFLSRTMVLQCGPLTKSGQLNQGLGYLIQQGIVGVVKEIKPKGKGTMFIDLMPGALLPFSSNGYQLRYVTVG
ncbi:MAG: DUF3987 domain-containing protein [Cellvibrionaceae bacterium]